jgi:Na+/proline symporter
LFAWSGLASAFAPVVLCSLFWRRTTWQGAVAGMTVGFLATVSWVLIFKDRFYDLYEMFPGFAAGFIVTIAVSVMTRPNDEAVQEFDEIWKEVNY